MSAAWIIFVHLTGGRVTLLHQKVVRVVEDAFNKRQEERTGLRKCIVSPVGRKACQRLLFAGKPENRHSFVDGHKLDQSATLSLGGKW